MELNEYQELALRTDRQPGSKDGAGGMAVPLLGLASKASEVMSEHKKLLRDGESYRAFGERLEEALGDVLWYLTSVADRSGLTLEQVAATNLEKTSRRWAEPTAHGQKGALPDEGFPPGEQLPRQMDIIIREVCGKALTTVNGKPYGDPLTDNRGEEDGYRFHDVFHLAYAAALGWSPTARALMGRKRRSSPACMEVEDSKRSVDIEEGIVAMVFNYAERREFLAGANSVEYGLLRTIREMTSYLEVGSRSEGEWERAILAGFSAWRSLTENGGGRLYADLEAGSLEIAGTTDGSKEREREHDHSRET